MRADLPIPLAPGERHGYATRLREIMMEHLNDDVIERYYERHKANVYPWPVELPKISSQTPEQNGLRNDHQEVLNVTNA
jgi:hypothetical protein